MEVCSLIPEVCIYGVYVWLFLISASLHSGNSLPPFPLLFPKLLCPLPLIISPETLFLKAS